MLKSPLKVWFLCGVATMPILFGSIEAEADQRSAEEQARLHGNPAVQANSNFACDLYRQLASENDGENLFFSPYSVSTALAMTAEGARGETALQMGQVLRFPDTCRNLKDNAQTFPWDMTPVHQGMAELARKLDITQEAAQTRKVQAQLEALQTRHKTALARVEEFERRELVNEQITKWSQATDEANRLAAEMNQLAAQIRKFDLRVANALWGEQTYPFRKQFMDTVGRHYGTGGVFPVDFKQQADAERSKINAWVEKQTNNRIRDLLPEGSLSPLTRLVLTNAIYFKSDWAKPFEARFTDERPFTLVDGKNVDAPMMYAPALDVARYGAFNADRTLFQTPLKIRPGTKKGLYPTAAGFAVVSLPYRGNDLSMVVIVPNKADGLAKLEQELSPQRLQQWIGQLQRRKVDVYLPKFKLETTYNLGDDAEPAALQKMGMVRAFMSPLEPNGADFSGMSESADPNDQLYISKVLHKAFVEVNEQGTEAAAATAVAVMAGGIPEEVPFTPEFKADRPFLFLIQENATGSVLFMGRMMKPAAAG